MLLGPTDLFGLREDISCISFLLFRLKKILKFVLQEIRELFVCSAIEAK